MFLCVLKIIFCTFIQRIYFFNFYGVIFLALFIMNLITHRTSVLEGYVTTLYLHVRLLCDRWDRQIVI